MYCSRCGSVVEDNATFCGNCGLRLAPVPPEPVGVSPIPAPVFAAPGVVAGAPPLTAPAVVGPSTYPAATVPYASPYAGFWLRLVAYIIDSAIILFGAAFFILIAVAIVGVGFFRNLGDQMDNGNAWAAPFVVMFFLMLCFLFVAAAWLYYAWFESSQHQGTLGKMALGLIVTDMEGRRVTFARATGRYFAKMITGLIPFFIGYIMAGFTEKKQALHDMIAGCLVLRRL